MNGVPARTSPSYLGRAIYLFPLPYGRAAPNDGGSRTSSLGRSGSYLTPIGRGNAKIKEYRIQGEISHYICNYALASYGMGSARIIIDLPYILYTKRYLIIYVITPFVFVDIPKRSTAFILIYIIYVITRARIIDCFQSQLPFVGYIYLSIYILSRRTSRSNENCYIRNIANFGVDFH
jgi:hypothetical protein